MRFQPRKLVLAGLLCCTSVVWAQSNEMTAKILSAYHGLDELPARANLLCGMNVAGQDGMPLTFSVQIDGDSIGVENFAVETATGESVTPLCATLRPAFEALENRTVLLVGPFGTEQAPPRAVEIVGELTDVTGNSLQGLKIENITALAAGPSLTYAERFASNQPGLENECPQNTAQAVLLTWEGGVTGPQGTALGEQQRTAISVSLANGSNVIPISLGDDDPDNHVVACISETSPAISVKVDAGFFHDPGDDANPATEVSVMDKFHFAQ